MSMLLPNLLCCYHFCHFDRKPLNHNYVYISFHHYHPCHFLHPYYHQQTSNHKHQSYNSRLEVQFEGLNPFRMSLKSLRIGGFLILKGSLKLKPNPSSSNPHPRIGGFLKLQTTNLKLKVWGLVWRTKTSKILSLRIGGLRGLVLTQTSNHKLQTIYFKPSNSILKLQTKYKPQTQGLTNSRFDSRFDKLKVWQTHG